LFNNINYGTIIYMSPEFQQPKQDENPLRYMARIALALGIGAEATGIVNTHTERPLVGALAGIGATIVSFTGLNRILPGRRQQ